ncbi:MAG: thioredoxin family protein [Gammaproteobacteria bacterium]|nr:thioredoxin family protein [Gammaproteobacteria bacterium]
MTRYCKPIHTLIEEAARAGNIDIEKVEDIAAIMGYGVMSTPGVVIDGTVVHAGGVPNRKAVEGWLAGHSGGHN